MPVIDSLLQELEMEARTTRRVLERVPDGLAVRARLRAAGFAVRRGDTFPGLGPDWLRIAVRDVDTTDGFLAALAQARTG